MRIIKLYIMALLLIDSPLAIASSQHRHVTETEQWVFFDMGNVLVDTRNRKRLKYVNQAHEFISLIRKSGYKIGLLINIPENFGNHCDDKYVKLQEILKKNWIDKRPLDWNQFDRVFLPPNDALQKPHPYLFLQAMAISCPQKIVFFGEDHAEVAQASSMGFATFQIDMTKSSPFPTLDQLAQAEAGAKLLINKANQTCQFRTKFAAAIAPTKLKDVESCEVEPRQFQK